MTRLRYLTDDELTRRCLIGDQDVVDHPQVYLDELCERLNVMRTDLTRIKRELQHYSMED